MYSFIKQMPGFSCFLREHVENVQYSWIALEKTIESDY